MVEVDDVVKACLYSQNKSEKVGKQECRRFEGNGRQGWPTKNNTKVANAMNG